jgi:hypothetical protein
MSTLFAMLVVIFAMLLTLVAAGLVVCYVAFISRGHDIPRAEWLSEAMRRGADRWQVPTEPAQHEDPDRQLHVRHGGIQPPSGR